MFDIIKRLFDLITALILLLVLMPVMFILILLLKVYNRGQIFFTQDRPGKKGVIFKLIKFKTMNDKRDATGQLLPDKVRLTRIGKFIRAASLDELPQLINVLKGDMSLIGPRPLLVKYLPLYSERQALRHKVRPGITGWAQVNGRNSVSWEEKFEMDVWYIEHQNFWLDLKIFWMTILIIIKRDGINAANAATMPPFTGSKN